MSVEVTIKEAVKAYKYDHKDSANPKPESIHLSPATYDDYLKELELTEDDNPVLTCDDVQIVKNETLADPIFLEPRSSHE
jgi:hypothetical protein